jgi:YD repeat-containing protein
MTDALGRTTSYVVDSAGYLLQETLPDMHARSCTYQEPNHELTRYVRGALALGACRKGSK